MPTNFEVSVTVKMVVLAKNKLVAEAEAVEILHMLPEVTSAKVTKIHVNGYMAKEVTK